MNKETLYVAIIGQSCYDLPKEMPIPQIGSKISIDNSDLVTVTSVRYHIVNDKLFQVGISCTECDEDLSDIL